MPFLGVRKSSGHDRAAKLTELAEPARGFAPPGNATASASPFWCHPDSRPTSKRRLVSAASGPNWRSPDHLLARPWALPGRPYQRLRQRAHPAVVSAGHRAATWPMPLRAPQEGASSACLTWTGPSRRLARWRDPARSEAPHWGCHVDTQKPNE